MPWELRSGGDPVWVGPRSLRIFLRQNRLFAGWWLFGLSFISFGFWVDAGGISSPFAAIPLGLLTGVIVWLGFMFAFSRGWLAEGD